jgi:hypothetical protein
MVGLKPISSNLEEEINSRDFISNQHKNHSLNSSLCCSSKNYGTIPLNDTI